MLSASLLAIQVLFSEHDYHRTAAVRTAMILYQ